MRGHVIAVEKLVELLADIPAGHMLEANDIGNLAILKDGDFVGYVDLEDEKVEWAS